MTQIAMNPSDTYDRMLTLSRTAVAEARTAGLDPLLVELVKVRVSQVNGCAFCLRMHSREALAAGETAERLFVLDGWREASYFSPAEAAALALAETITRIGEHGVSSDDRAAAGESLSAEQVAAVAWLAVVMNAWNRIAITSGYAVRP